jgi:NarL family two-component system response regulator LiaR
VDTGTEAQGFTTTEIQRNLRVIVAEDDPFARMVIREALERAAITVVGEADNGRQAVDLALRHRPDAVVMDVAMPQLDGLAATRHIVSADPCQVIILVSRGDDEATGLACLRAGAVGFLTKDLDIEALPRAVEGAVKGEAAISRRLSMRLIERLHNLTGRSSLSQPVRSPSLTPREWEVIDLLAQGMTTDQIADSLHLASETVRSHVKHILRKLDARSRGEAVAAAQRIRDAAGWPSASRRGSVK